MSLIIKKTRSSFYFEKFRNYLLVIEIALFPWINFSDLLNYVFLGLIAINVFISLLISITNGKFRSISNIDIFLGGIVAISIFNIGSYWMELSSESPWLRMLIFFIRYLTFPKDFLYKNIDLLFKALLISSICVLYTWFFLELPNNSLRLVAPYGDPNYMGFIFGSYAILAMCYSVNFKASSIYLVLILLSTFILLLTASRGSILAFFVASLFILIKDYYRGFVVIVFLIFLSQIAFISDLYLDLYIVERLLEPRSSDIGAANSRFIEIQAAFNNFNDNIMNILFGHGLSSSNQTSFGGTNNHRIHNSFIAILYDQGVIGSMLAMIMGLLMLMKSKKNGLLPLMIFFSINSMTIFILTFYPFYIYAKLIQEEKR